VLHKVDVNNCKSMDSQILENSLNTVIVIARSKLSGRLVVSSS
jgi:hypothetical protein